MAWIQTVPLAEADEKLLKALEGQRELYPIEYATPVQPTDEGTAGIVVVAHTDSRGAIPRVRDIWRAHVARASTRAAAARDDRDDGLGD